MARLVMFADVPILSEQVATVRVVSTCDCGCASVGLRTEGPQVAATVVARLSSTGRDDYFPATEFAERQAVFLAAMTGGLAGLAAIIDAKDYTGEGQQSLRFTQTALAALMRASSDAGVDAEVLKPVHDIVRRQIAAGSARRAPPACSRN